MKKLLQFVFVFLLIPLLFVIGYRVGKENCTKGNLVLGNSQINGSERVVIIAKPSPGWTLTTKDGKRFKLWIKEDSIAYVKYTDSVIRTENK